MKRNYQAPQMKVMHTECVMAINPTSNGYEQGVPSGEGTDAEGRAPLF